MSDATLQPSTVFQDRYRIERLLAQGGMGAVYVARQLSVDRPVALKVIAPHRLDDTLEKRTLALSRFEREAQAIAQASHPNIVSLIDFGATDEGERFLVMELLEGEPLGARLDREGALPQGVVLELATQLLDGLAHAHALGVVHRDLKPDNLFLADVGAHRPPLLKLVDFGLAKPASEPAEADGVTEESAIVGSPGYMAPEQLRGSSVGPGADLYAVGAILYRMITGRRVFEADNRADLLTRHIVDLPPPLTRDSQRLSGPLPELVLQCLAKRPEDRPQTAVEALERMTGLRDTPWVAGGSAVDADTGTDTFESGVIDPPLEVAQVPSKPARRRPAWLMPAALVVVLGAATAAGLLLSGGATKAVAPTPLSVSGPAPLSVARVDGPSIAPTPAPPAVTPPAPAKKAAPRVATVTSDPTEAEVWSGQTRLGTTPLPVPLDPGVTSLTVTLKKRGFRAESAQLTQGATTQVKLRRTPKKPRGYRVVK